jgi:hypothetical protein
MSKSFWKKGKECHGPEGSLETSIAIESERPAGQDDRANNGKRRTDAAADPD